MRGSFGRLGWGFGILVQLLAISAVSANINRHHPVDTSDNNGAPQCLDNSGSPLDINNDQVVQWKTSTPNQYLARAHVSGTVFAVYPDQTGHAHFGIMLDNEPQDSSGTLEVIYDLEFGSIPTVNTGDRVEACGDWINSYAPAGHYQASPDGAIIHWIHKSDSSKHEDGFLIINNSLYGQELPNN